MNFSEQEIRSMLNSIEIGRYKHRSGALADLAIVLFAAHFRPHTKQRRLYEKVRAEVDSEVKRLNATVRESRRIKKEFREVWGLNVPRVQAKFFANKTIDMEKNVIAKTLYAEARGEGERGMRAVASVIYNRARGDVGKFAAVCLAPKQFRCWPAASEFTAPTAPADAAAYKICLKIESEMSAAEFTPLGSWTHYYNPRLSSPSWARGRPFTAIGNHNFLKI